MLFIILYNTIIQSIITVKTLFSIVFSWYTKSLILHNLNFKTLSYIASKIVLFKVFVIRTL